jgi:DNA-binding transcriptional MerR regulator
MKTFAEMTRSGDHTIPDRLALLEEHDAAVEAEIARLTGQRAKIQAKIAYYRSVTVREAGETE